MDGVNSLSNHSSDRTSWGSGTPITKQQGPEVAACNTLYGLQRLGDSDSPRGAAAMPMYVEGIPLLLHAEEMPYVKGIPMYVEEILSRNESSLRLEPPSLGNRPPGVFLSKELDGSDNNLKDNIKVLLHMVENAPSLNPKDGRKGNAMRCEKSFKKPSSFYGETSTLQDLTHDHIPVLAQILKSGFFNKQLISVIIRVIKSQENGFVGTDNESIEKIKAKLSKES
jgi:hypothetical protein